MAYLRVGGVVNEFLGQNGFALVVVCLGRCIDGLESDIRQVGVVLVRLAELVQLGVGLHLGNVSDGIARIVFDVAIVMATMVEIATELGCDLGHGELNALHNIRVVGSVGGRPLEGEPLLAWASCHCVRTSW
jgi:hypothetical protein